MDTITTDDHTYFNGRLSPYSNFFKCHFEVDNISYSCVEQFYQRAKSLHANNKQTAAEIMLSTDPGHMKSLGDRIYSNDAWIYVQQQHMETALRAKFDQSDHLCELLVKTGERKFVEANAHDRIWGVGIGLRNPAIQDQNKWNGKNKLGLLLDSIRDEFKLM